MNSLRLIVLTIIGWLVYWLLRRLTNKIQTPANRPGKGVRMVRCAWCDIYITEQDAIRDDNTWYCSTEHHQHMINKSKE